jgi:hypothetical protein
MTEHPTFAPTGPDPVPADGRFDAVPAPGPDQHWTPEPAPHELPPRPRRRLVAPLPLALLGTLLTACGFIGGVLVEKGQGSGSTGAGALSGGGSALAARLASLRGAGAGTGGSGAAGLAGSATAQGISGAAAPGRGGSGGGFSSPFGGGSATVGEVAFVEGTTLYVINAEGNTVRVNTSPASNVTRTVTSKVAGIHPGETVVVTGATQKSGAISASSIRVGSGAGGGGIAALFAGSGGGGGPGG